MTAHSPDPLHILSAGAAQGLVTRLAPKFFEETGVALRTTFGAVGAIREKLAAGERCDVLILTDALIKQLATGRHASAGTSAALGRVQTGIGVRMRDALPSIDSQAALEQSLRMATDVFVPDLRRSTAGVHFARVLQQLAILEEMTPRLRAYPNGATAMRALAQSNSRSPIGCTQVTEIKFTEGVMLVGPLPRQFELSTVYSIAVQSDARQPEAAQRFARLLSGAATASVRAEAGFEAA